MLKQHYQYTHTAVPQGYGGVAGQITVGKRGDEWVARWVGSDEDEPDLRTAKTERDLMLELCRVGVLEWLSGNVGLVLPFLRTEDAVVTEETKDALKVLMPGSDEPQWLPKRALKCIPGAVEGGGDGYRLASWFNEQNAKQTR